MATLLSAVWDSKGLFWFPRFSCCMLDGRAVCKLHQGTSIPRAWIFRGTEHLRLPLSTVGCGGALCFQKPHLQFRSAFYIYMNKRPEYCLSISGRALGNQSFPCAHRVLQPELWKQRANVNPWRAHCSQCSCQKDIFIPEKGAPFFRVV